MVQHLDRLVGDADLVRVGKSQYQLGVARLVGETRARADLPADQAGGLLDFAENALETLLDRGVAQRLKLRTSETTRPVLAGAPFS